MGSMETQSMMVNSTLTVMDDVSAQQDLKVEGSLYANGPAVFANSVQMATLSGGGISQILSDNNGNLFKGPALPPTWACNPAGLNWNLAGNNISVLNNTPNQGLSDIGTCDQFDFILKANDVKRQWIKPDGKIGFGIQNPGSTNGPEYQFHQGVARLSGMNSFGGPQIIFDGGTPSINGDWGIEYLPVSNTSVPGLNFWKPSGSVNSFNYLFFLDDTGPISVGMPTPLNPARFNVDGWNGNGIKSMCFSAQKALIAFNKNSNAETFAVYGNGNTSMGINNQIGFPSTQILNNAHSLLINNQTINGVKFLSTDANVRIISAQLNDNGASLFTVFGDGRTKIGGEFNTSSNYMLTVNGKIGAREIKVSIQNPWPDYVFKQNYVLAPLDKVENYIVKHEHLPGIPSAQELQKEELGLDLAQMQALQLEKIENIYLYLIEMKKEINALKKENALLQQKLKN